MCFCVIFWKQKHSMTSARSFWRRYRAEISVMCQKTRVSAFAKKDTVLKRSLCEKTPEAAAGHNTLVLKKKTFLASTAHERTDRTSRRAEIPPPEEAALRAAPQRGTAAFGGRPPLWSPLVLCAMLAKSVFFPKTKVLCPAAAWSVFFWPKNGPGPERVEQL